jgi:oligopeptide transport system substrate-binding protein
MNRYKAGEIDIVYTVPINQFAQLKKTLGSELDVSPQLATYYYEFNTTRPPFNDARVRKALNMALDKDIIAGKVLGQGQRPAWLISQPDIGGVKLQNPDYASWPLDKRIAEAKKLLSEAGYNESHPLRFNLLYNTSESHQRIAIAASSMWKKTSAWTRSCKIRSGKPCWIPCTPTTLTRCVTHGLRTTTMQQPS